MRSDRSTGGARAACLTAGLFGLMVAGCSEPQQPADKAAPPPAATAAVTPPANPALEAINAAQFTPPAPEPPPQNAAAAPDANVAATAEVEPAFDPMLIKAEVLLDRARFSPGVVDGKDGTNLHHAIQAFQEARGLTVSGDLDAATWAALTADTRPVVASYTLTEADVAGPFSPDVGEDFVKMAELPSQGFTRATEALGERFHMDEELVKSLNPGVDFTKAGVAILVASAGAPPFAKGDVDHIEISKKREQVTAFDKAGVILAVYPATVGSRERPSPEGTYKVNGVASAPDYTYDPAKLSWGPRSKGKLVISAGPNNPVGQVWIDLNRPSYGIHGSPDPKTIGKTASHGCVRLTNWDAVALGQGVKPGVVVKFV